MSLRKNIISSTYNFRMKFSKLTGVGINISENRTGKKALVNFYSLKAITNPGKEISFQEYAGRKVLIVNLASECGYTPQYAGLEQLNCENKNVVILGFPSNDFGGQEPGSDDDIANFCKVNYGVTFQLFKKDSVSGIHKQPVYQWLSDANKNGWNSKEPQWNFYKYLIDESGNLSKIFSSSVSPDNITL